MYIPGFQPYLHGAIAKLARGFSRPGADLFKIGADRHSYF